jgi:hypothetical protein
VSESNCVDEDYSYFSIEFISSRNLSWVWKGIGGSENVNVHGTWLYRPTYCERVWQYNLISSSI